MGILTINAQQLRGYTFVNGWAAKKVIETDSLFYVFGPGNGDSFGYFSIDISKIDSNLLLIQDSVGYQAPNSKSTAFQSASCVLRTNATQIHIAGYAQDLDDTSHANLYTFSSDSITREITKYGYKTYPYALIENSGSFSVFGTYLTAKQSPGEILGFAYNTTEGWFKQYACQNFTIWGGCYLLVNNALKTEDGYLLGCEEFSKDFSAVRDGLIIKVDSQGEELWRLRMSSDTFSTSNFHIMKLGNGNFLATWHNEYFKPYMNEPDQWLPTVADHKTYFFAEFNIQGKLVKRWNINNHLRKVFKTPDSTFYSFTRNVIQTADGGSALVGYTYDFDTSQLVLGYLLKLDAQGQFQWYRHYKINIAPPYNFGKEQLYLYGVTELENGGYALAGEYRSHPSDSFPNGTQKGIVLFVDEDGCLEPNCKVLESIDPHLPITNRFHIYPNPTKNTLNIKPNSSSVNVQDFQIIISDLFGRTIQDHPQMEQQLDVSHLSSGLYYLTILNQTEGVREIHKIIVE